LKASTEAPLILMTITPVPEPVQSVAGCVHQVGVDAVSLDHLPAAIRADLHSHAPELPPADGPFNASDVGVGPRTRFIAAVHYKDRYVVAYEHGGRGYHVDLLTYGGVIAGDAHIAPLARHVTFDKPKCADLDVAVALPPPRTPYKGPDW
jgi:hypothetical protein